MTATNYPGIKETKSSGLLPEWLTVITGYTLLATIMTWPLISGPGNHLIGAGSALSGDGYQNLWYMWWYGRALELGQDPTQTHLMYGLLPSVQVLISSVINGILMWPVWRLFGPLMAYNLAIFLSYVLGGLFTYQLIGEFTRNKLARFTGGFFFIFCTYHLFRSEGHLGLLTIQWLPFYAWRLFVLRRVPTLKNSLFAALGLVLAALSDLYYLGYFVIPFSLIFVVWFGWFDRKVGYWQWQRLRWTVLALFLGFLALLPFYNVFLRLESGVTDSVAARARETKELSADLLAFFIPSFQNPIFGSLTAPVHLNFQGKFPVEQGVYLGYVLLFSALAVVLVKEKRNRLTAFWLVTAGAAFILALGPRLHVGGKEIDLPLPYVLYTRLPLLNTYRAPSRFGIVLELALAVMAGISLGYFFDRYFNKPLPKITTTKWTIAAGLMGLFFIESTVFPWPLPATEAPIPQLYQQIASEPGDFLVLELPLGPNSAPLYYQTEHQKPLVGGYPSRISNQMVLSIDKVPYLGMFNSADSNEMMDGSAAKLESPDIFNLGISFKDSLKAANIRYVILRNYPNSPRPYRWMRPYLEQQLGAPIYQSNETSEGEPLLAWKIESSNDIPAVKAGELRIRLGDGWLAGLRRGTDGQLQRYTTTQSGQLLLEVSKPEKVRLSFRYMPVIRPQTIIISQDGKATGQKIDGIKEWVSYNATIELNLHQGINRIELGSDKPCLVSADLIPNSDDVRCYNFGIQTVKAEIIP